MTVGVAGWWWVMIAARAETGAIPLAGALDGLSGSGDLVVGLYDGEAAIDPWWTDAFAVTLDRGRFAVDLGSGAETLDLDAFATTADLWVGVSFAGSAEARAPVGWSPRAAYAAQAGTAAFIGATPSAEVATTTALNAAIATVQGALTALAASLDDTDAKLAPGMIAFFPSSCPAGWTEYTALRGRVAVGLPASGTAGGSQGAALPDLGARTITAVPSHVHAVNPPLTTSTDAGGHSHTVDPGAITPSTSSAAPEILMHGPGSGGNQGRWNMDWGTQGVYGSQAAYPGTYGAGLQNFLSQSAHAHSVTVDVPSTTSSSQANHNHTVDVPTFDSAAAGQASVDVTMPYLQLMACQLN